MSSGSKRRSVLGPSRVLIDPFPIELQIELLTKCCLFRMENILSGNPLLRDLYAPSAAAEKSDMKVKRRWDDDVVFKNCSR